MYTICTRGVVLKGLICHKGFFFGKRGGEWNYITRINRTTFQIVCLFVCLYVDVWL